MLKNLDKCLLQTKVNNAFQNLDYLNPTSTTKLRSQKKNDIIWEFFPNVGHDRHICLIISKIDIRIFAKKGLREQNIVFPGQYSQFRLPRINFDEKSP